MSKYSSNFHKVVLTQNFQSPLFLVKASLVIAADWLSESHGDESVYDADHRKRQTEKEQRDHVQGDDAHFAVHLADHRAPVAYDDRLDADSQAAGDGDRVRYQPNDHDDLYHPRKTRQLVLGGKEWVTHRDEPLDAQWIDNHKHHVLRAE